MFVIKGIFAFLALFQVISAQPVLQDVTPYAFESKINETLEMLREVIKNGIPDKGIPQLDPFHLEHFDTFFDIEKVITAAFSLDNVSFSGIGDFHVSNLKLSVITFKLTFDAIIPRIELSGLYKTNGVLMQFVDLFGDGEFGMFVDNFKIGGSASVSIGGGLAIKKLNLNLGLENVQFALTGLMTDEFSESLVSTLNEIVTPILNDFEKEISAAISVFLLEIINKILKPENF